jgi:O-antigen/teichoic acid export membrane protein
MLKQKFLVDFGSKIIIYAMTAVIGIIVSRMLGPKVIGTVSFGYSYVSMFYFLFGLFGTSHIKAINEGKNFFDCVKVYTIIILSTLIVFNLSLLIFTQIQRNYFDISFTSEEIIIITISTVTVSLQGLLKIPDITFTALVQQVKINLPNLISTIVHNLGRILTLILGYQAIALATSKLVSIILVVPVYLFLLKKNFFSGKWRNEIFKEYVKIGVPLFVITMSISLMSNYSRVFLKNSSSVNELGFFTAAMGLASIMIMIGDTAGSLFFPLFSKAFAVKKFETIKNQVAKFERFLILFVFPVILILSIFSNTIITLLLSEKYMSSIPIFSILLLFAFVKIWSIPYYNLVNGINKFNLNAYLHAFYVFIFFLILYFFVNQEFLNLGGLGLAYGLLILELIKLLAWYLISNKTLSFSIDRRWKFYILFYAVIGIGFNLVYKLFVLNQGYLVQIIALIFMLGAIFVIMFFSKVLLRKDILEFVQLLNLKALLEYIKKEIRNK